MSKDYLQVAISAETKEQDDDILNGLLERKFVTGGQIINAPPKFLWKGKITDMDYCTVFSYTMGKFKQRIIKAVERISIEEVPMITFTPFEANKKLMLWID